MTLTLAGLHGLRADGEIGEKSNLQTATEGASGVLGWKKKLLFSD